MKKILAFVIVSVLFLTCFVPMAMAAESNVVTVETKQVYASQAGEQVTLAVITSAPAASFEASVSTELENMSITAGSFEVFVTGANGLVGGATSASQQPAGSVMFYVTGNIPADAEQGDFYSVSVSVAYVSPDNVEDYATSVVNGGVKILCAHDFADATCTDPKTCKLCGATEGAALGHDWKDADCTNPKTCKVCGVTEGAALDHDMKEIEAAIPATCEGEGKTAVMECSRCGHKEGGAKIDALGHDWELTKSEAGADCLTAGKDTYTCKNDKTHVDVRDNTKYGPHADEKFASNNNGTHDGYCPKCEQKLSDDEKCFDTNKDGKCDGCGYKIPAAPTKPDDGKDDVPKTGDITPYPVYFLVALMAVAAAAYGLKRKFDI